MPYYIISKSHKNGQFFWNLKADNHEPILTSSELYVSKQGAQKSISSSKACIQKGNFKVDAASNGEHYFLQKANNGEDLGKSETYTSAQNCKQSIDLVIQYAPDAPVKDATS